MVGLGAGWVQSAVVAVGLVGLSAGVSCLGQAAGKPARAATTPVKAEAASSATAAVGTAAQASEEGAAQAAHGAAPGQATAPKPQTAARLELLPAPLPASLTKGIDVEHRSTAILAHLNEVIRFYRMAVAPIQKTGEPSDVLYAEQAEATATQAAQLAFQSARDEAALLARIQVKPGVDTAAAPTGETQRLSASQQNAAKQMRGLEAQDAALETQIGKARAKDVPALEQEKEAVEGQLELAKAMSEALAKVAGISNAQTNSGLQGEINRLQSAVPELVNNKVKPVASTLESLGSLRDAGVSTQAMVLFQLLGTRTAIDAQIDETQKLHDQAVELRTPLVKILRATLEVGRTLESQDAANVAGASPAAGAGGAAASAGATPAAATGANDLAGEKKTYDELTDAFKAISAVSVPISAEVLVLEQSRANLMSWRAAVDAEKSTILRSLMVRLILIGGALAVIFGLGEVWRRATTKYVQDVRRRRQILLIRRMVIGFLSGVVLILGFVTQFSSLATFAGFITAGIAVGLQSILLSVAAYFFIVGRYGVRVGDRITVAGVTGDVVEVGLVRFYMMELTGTGTELHPTGRIAVFANSVLFQTGTPLYKQIPGTDYAWHEISLKLKPETDYKVATDAVLQVVEQVYDGYKGNIEQQHAKVEQSMDAALRGPKIETRLELKDGLRYSVLYPVQIACAAATDQLIVQKVLEKINGDVKVGEAVDGPPAVQAVIKS
jgi:hypothetical protein